MAVIEVDLGSVIGPQGPTGPQGPQGPVGPQGPQGEPGSFESLPEATQEQSGLLSADDKQKLDTIDLSGLMLKVAIGEIPAGNTVSTVDAPGITKPFCVNAMSGDIPVVIDWSVSQGSLLNVSVAQSYSNTIDIFVLYF